MKRYKKTKLRPVQQIVFDEVMKAIDSGVVPWRSQFLPCLPYNGVSKKEYCGINLLLLALRPFPSAEFLTFKQVNDLGGKVIEGSKSILVVFYKAYKSKSKEKESDQLDVFGDGDNTLPDTKTRYVLRYYRVFNVSQTTLWTDEKKAAAKLEAQESNEVDERCQSIVDGMPNAPAVSYAPLHHPCYIPAVDRVNMPTKEQYEAREAFYTTLFHELTHSTGHVSRLDRFRANDLHSVAFGSRKYSQEELVAEMGAAFLAARAGILQPQIDNMAAYINGWRSKLTNDPQALFKAAADAQRAFDYIVQKQ